MFAYETVVNPQIPSVPKNFLLENFFSNKLMSADSITHIWRYASGSPDGRNGRRFYAGFLEKRKDDEDVRKRLTRK
jgi:hypothetical protein